MSKARDLADSVSTGGILEDGAVSVSEISDLTVTAAELNNVAGVNSDVQTQLDLKAPLASPSFTGNVGVGTSSQLAAGSVVNVVAGSDYAPAITIGSNASATNWARMDFKNTNAADTGIIYQDQTGNFSIRNDGANPITFFTNGANERMRIDSSGNVGVGTSSPDAKLKVTATGANLLVGYSGTQNYFDASENIFRNFSGTEHLRIGSSGQLGLSGTNYGTAGQVLTSGGSGAAPTWADAAGGGSIEAVASGTIANGDLVSLNSDGTVSVTGGFGLTPVTYNSNNTEGNKAVYDTLNDKVVVTYRDTSLGTGYAVVGTVSGTTISFGTPVPFSTPAESPYATFDSTNNKVVITYYDPTSSNNGKAVVGTVSGTSISFGSIATFASTSVSYPKVAFDSNAGKVVVVYRDNNNNAYGTAVVGTVSGTSISFGTPVVFSAKNPTNFPFPVFDSNSNKMVVLYKDGSGKVKVGTVSGTSISFGSEATFQAATVEDVTGTFDSDNNKVIAIWHYTSGQGAAAVGTVSGTSISFGSATTFETNSINLPSAAYDPVANVVGVAYRDQTVLKSKYVSLTVSGTSITAADPVILIDENSAHNGLLYDPDEEVFVHTAQVQSDTTAKGQIYNASANINNWVGVATAAVSDTSTGTFTVVSGVNESQSGLTVGARYYISSDGVLSTTENTGYEMGRALSATKLLVTHGSVG